MEAKRSLTKNEKMLYASLSAIAVTGTLIGIWRHYGKSDTSPTNPNSKELGMSDVEEPILIAQSPRSGGGNGSAMLFEVDRLVNIGEEEFEKIKLGKFQVKGDVDGSQAAALKKLANAKNVTPGLFRKLAAATTSNEAPTEELNNDDKAVIEELKTAYAEDLNIIFTKTTANIPKEKEIKTPIETEEQKHLQEKAERKEKEKSAYEIDISALTTQESIIAAFNAIPTENFTVKIKAGHAVDEQLKQCLIKAVKENGLSLEILKRLLSKTTEAGDEPVLEKLRDTLLETALGVPHRLQKRFSDYWKDFNKTLISCGDAYENGNEPNEAEKESLATKLQAAITFAQSIEDPATITDVNERNMVTLLKSNPSAETFYFEHFHKKLIASIKACTTDPRDVENITVAMRNVCSALFISNLGDAFDSATKMPDVQLRKLVYGDSASWSAKTLDMSATLSSLLLFNIEKSVKDSLIVLDNQHLYKLYLETQGTAYQANLEVAIKTAASLSVDSKAYSEKTFVEESDSAARRSILATRLSDFNTNFQQVAEIVNLQLPELAKVKKDPFSRCMARFGEFGDLLADYFREPTEAKVQTMQIVLTDAQALCADPNVGNPPAGINQTLAEFFKAGYQELWTESVADDPVEVEINCFLQAVRYIDAAFLDGKSARKLLKEYYLSKLSANLTARDNVRETRANWGRCRNFCEPADHPAVAVTSIETYFERHIESELNAAISNVATDVAVIEDIHKEMQFFNLFKPSNKFVIFVDSVLLVKYVNFNRQVGHFIAAEADCRNTNLLTAAVMTNLKTAVNNIIGSVPLTDDVADKLEDPHKKAHTLLKALKPNIDAGLEAHFFDIFNRQLETLILNFNNGDKNPVARQIANMKLACDNSFIRAYPGVVDINSGDAKLNDLKLLVVRNAFRRNVPLTIEMRAGLVSALACDTLILRAGMTDNIRKLMLQLVDKEALLKAYFVEDDAGMRSEIAKFISEAAAYKNLLVAYETGSFEDQATADLKFTELTVAFNRLKALHGAISTKVPINPFSAPEKKDFSLPAECSNAHKQLNTVFDTFLANPSVTASRDNAKTAFESARAKCAGVTQKIKARDGSIKEIRLVYSGEFATFVDRYYAFLLAEADRTADPATMNLAVFRDLSAIMPEDNNLLNNYKRRLLTTLAAGASAADFKALYGKWQKMINVDLCKVTSDLVIESMKDMVWECFTKDKSGHAQCIQGVIDKTTNINAMFSNTIKPQALLNKILEKRAIAFVTDFDALVSKNESAMVIDLLKFKNATLNMEQKYFTQPIMKCWINAAYYWTTYIGAYGFSFGGSYQSVYFFMELLNQYISLKDDIVINDALKVIKHLVTKHPNEARKVKGASAYCLDTLKKTKGFDLELMWSAAKVLPEMSHLAQMKDVLKTIDARRLTPEFYAQLVNATPTECQLIKLFLEGKSTTLPHARTGFEIILEAFDVPQYIEALKKFEAVFNAICVKLENKKVIAPNELNDLNAKRAEIVAAAKVIRNPALIQNDKLKSTVTYFTAEPSIEKLFFDRFYPQLEESIRRCRNRTNKVQLYVDIMKDYCPDDLNVKCNGIHVEYAENIPDVKLRAIVYTGVWDYHQAVNRLNELILPIHEDAREVLIAFGNNANVFQFFFNANDAAAHNVKEIALIEASRLAADIEKYKGNSYISEADSKAAFKLLKKKVLQFFNVNRDFPKIDELSLPPIQPADPSPNGRYKHLAGAFMTNLENFLADPKQNKVKSLKDSQQQAINASRLVGSNIAIRSEVNTLLDQLLKRIFNEEFNAAKNNEMTKTELGKLNKKLIAAQLFDNHFNEGMTAATMLCEHHYIALSTALANLNPVQANDASLNWKKCASYCAPDVKPLLNAGSLKLHLEAEIDAAINKTICDKVDVSAPVSMAHIDRKIQFLRAAEPNNKYAAYATINVLQEKIVESSLVSFVKDLPGITRKNEAGMLTELEAFKTSVAAGGNYHAYRAHFSDMILKCWMEAAGKWQAPARSVLGYFFAAPVRQSIDFFKLLLTEYLKIPADTRSEMVKLVKYLLEKNPQVFVKEFKGIDVQLESILNASAVATQELIDVLKLACSHLPNFMRFKPHLDAWEVKGVKAKMTPAFYTQFFKVDLKKDTLTLFTNYLNDKGVPKTTAKPIASPGLTDELVKALP